MIAGFVAGMIAGFVAGTWCVSRVLIFSGDCRGAAEKARVNGLTALPDSLPLLPILLPDLLPGNERWALVCDGGRATDVMDMRVIPFGRRGAICSRHIVEHIFKFVKCEVRYAKDTSGLRFWV